MLALSFLAVLPCILHVPQLIGWISCNPVFFVSGLRDFPWHRYTDGACFLDGNAGGTIQALGREAARQWLNGSVPWWNHYSGAGLPLASIMQSSALFFPFVLLHAYFDGLLYLKLLLQVMTGVFTWLFLRQTGLTKFTSLLGSVYFELNGSFTLFSDAPMQPIAFLPMLMWGIERCRAQAAARTAGGPAIVAVAIGYSLLAGFPETAFVDGVLALLWAVVRADVGPKVRFAYGAKIASGGICGLLLASPAVLPFLHDLKGSNMGLHLFSQMSTIGASQALFILFPAMFGAPNANSPMADWVSPWGYIGPSLSLLALLGVLTGPWDRRKAMLAAWFLFCLGGAFRWPIAGALRDLLPGFNQIDFGRYVGPSAEFAAVMLASQAVERWRSNAGAGRLWTSVILLTCVGAYVLYAGQVRLGYLLHTNWGWSLFAVSIAGALACVAGLSILLARPSTRSARVAWASIVVLESFAFALPPVLAGTTDVRTANPAVSYLQRNAGFARAYSMGDTLLPNYGAYYGVSQVNEFYLPLASVWADYERRLSTLETPTLFNGLAGTAVSRIADFKAHRAAFTSAGVAFIMTLARDDILSGKNDPLFVPVFDDGRTHIYRLPDASPYFEIKGGPCTIDARTRDRVITECKASAELIRREMAFRSWTVWVNGQQAKLHNKPDIFQAVELQSGKSQITWRYRPSGYVFLTALFCIGLLWLSLMFITISNLAGRISLAKPPS